MIDRWNAWRAYEQPPEGYLAVGIKDVINTADFSTEMGSPAWAGFTPGNDARVVTKLKEAGCVIAGKTVSAEFAVHHPGPTLNPHDPTRTPGTSSSGSAVAVACGMVPAAIGTQTAGSIIRPASYCGVYAMKPSFGLIPRTGVLKTADTLDTIGFFTETPELLRTMLDICRVDGPDYPQITKLKTLATVKRVGVLRPSCQKEWPVYALRMFETWVDRLGEFFDLDEFGLDDEPIHQIHRTIYHKSLSYYFQREIEAGQVSEAFKAQAEEGKQISLEDYRAALQAQELISESFDTTLQQFDVLVTLSSGGDAPKDESQAPRDTNLVWTLAGAPVINIPAFVSPDGLPFGVSIIARKYHDYKLFGFLDTLIKAGLAPTGLNPRL
jgi:Asp-tRNA(Asn)/Glu-tRNA(Gln) amidotransferase A subunit family amidase